VLTGVDYTNRLHTLRPSGLLERPSTTCRLQQQRLSCFVRNWHQPSIDKRSTRTARREATPLNTPPRLRMRIQRYNGRRPRPIKRQSLLAD